MNASPRKKSASGASAVPHRTIRAAVLRQGGRPMRIETLDLEGPRPDEVLVRIAASGVCHTDIGFWEAGESWPVVLGHEGAGVVEEVGSGVKGVAPGDHVVLSYQSCGVCPACRRDRPTHCEHFWDLNFGFARLDGSNALEKSGVRGHFFGQSSFADHSLVTTRNLVKVDRDLPLELLAPLGCGLQTGAATVLIALGVKEGQSVLVLGAGSVGLAAVMAAKIAGADPIVAVDLHPSRLKLAKELGATHTLHNRGQDLERALRKIAPQGLDQVLEITGVRELHDLGLEFLKLGGGMALLTGDDGPGELPDGRRVFGTIQGDAVPQRFIPELIAHHRAGRFPFDRLVTFRPFSAINEAIAESLRGTIIKPVLRMDESAA